MSVKSNYKAVINNIVKTKDQHSLQQDVKVIAVTKYQDVDKIKEAIDAGIRIFGENKVQDAYKKWPEILKEYKDIKLHMIGSLQTNKIKDALKLFDVIESIEKIKQLVEIAKYKNEDFVKTKDFFVQVNIGAEEQKGGVNIKDLPDLLAKAKELDIKISGLMCVPPVDEFPAPYFALLKKLANDNELKLTSMGMSSDYEIAVAQGANIIRVGSFLFKD